MPVAITASDLTIAACASELRRLLAVGKRRSQPSPGNEAKERPAGGKASPEVSR
jgi:hypothetical protein